MGHAFEVFYSFPADLVREQAIIDLAARFGAILDYREESDPADCPSARCVALTFVCSSEIKSGLAESALRDSGEHVEPIGEYPDS